MDDNKRSGDLSNEQQDKRGPQQGEYKNVETAVNNASSFGDDYESKREDELTMEEPKTEKEGSVGKK